MNTKSYHYLESGLPNVWLANGFTVHETDYGSGVSIDDVAELHQVILMHRNIGEDARLVFEKRRGQW